MSIFNAYAIVFHSLNFPTALYKTQLKNWAGEGEGKGGEEREGVGEVERWKTTSKLLGGVGVGA